MLAVSSLEKVEAIRYHPPSLVTSLLAHLPQCCRRFFLHGQCNSAYCQYNDSSHMTLAGFLQLAVAFAGLDEIYVFYSRNHRNFERTNHVNSNNLLLALACCWWLSGNRSPFSVNIFFGTLRPQHLIRRSKFSEEDATTMWSPRSRTVLVPVLSTVPTWASPLLSSHQSLTTSDAQVVTGPKSKVKEPTLSNKRSTFLFFLSRNVTQQRQNDTISVLQVHPVTEVTNETSYNETNMLMCMFFFYLGQVMREKETIAGQQQLQNHLQNHHQHHLWMKIFGPFFSSNLGQNQTVTRLQHKFL